MAILQIPITKAGKGVVFEVDTEELNAFSGDTFERIVEEGLKTLLNSRMSKLAAPSKLTGDEFENNKAAALAKAAENFSDLKAGKLVKKAAASTKGVDRATMTEARRLAKEVVKNEIRKAGMKPSQVEAKDITAAANELIASDSSYIEQATVNLAERATKPTLIDIKALVKESPKLKAKAAEKAAAARTTLSAKQAGKVAPRKPKATIQPTAH